MAKLDLIPDVQVMLIQGAIFGVAAAVIKANFVTPFLKLKDRRLAATEGSKTESADILKQCDVRSKDIEAKMKKALEHVQSTKAAKKDAAVLRQKELVASAENAAKEKIRAVEASVRSALQNELSRRSAAVANLTQELYNNAIS